MHVSRFCFTLWDQVPTVIEPHTADQIGYACFQREIAPTTGNYHWQGYLEFKGQKRLDTANSYLRKQGWKKFDLRRARGTPQQNKDYCSKSETAIPDTFQEIGTPVEMVGTPGKRTDLDEAFEMIKEGMTPDDVVINCNKMIRYHKHLIQLQSIISSAKAKEIRQLEVYYYWGPPGTGKSRAVFEQAPNAYRPLIHCPHIWFENYQGEDTIVLDDIDLTKFPREAILQMLDIYPVRLPFKGGSVQAQYTKVYITSNVDPINYDAALTRRFKANKFFRKAH